MNRCDDEFVEMRVEPALRCGMPGCRNHTTLARAERDLEHPGLWVLMPICTDCRILVNNNKYRHMHVAETGAGAR